MKILFGLKAWSINLGIIDTAEMLHDRGDLDYIELFTVPDSFQACADAWKGKRIPFVVHAPHSLSGLNFSKPEMEMRNIELAEQSFRWADLVHADTVIFHPGTGGSLKETVRQASKLRDSRMIMENKPHDGLDGSICVGSSPGEIKKLTEALGVGFCLDFGHAIEAANSYGQEPIGFVKQFLDMKPRMFHMTDGDYSGKMDRHDAYGQGDFPLDKLLSMVPSGFRLTDEAKRKNPESLDEYLADRNFVRGILETEAV